MTEKIPSKESYNFGVDTKAKLYTKTTVDDITNSVALKKEAQLSICEKRIIELEKENEQLKKENHEYKSLLQYMGMVMSDDGVKNIRNELALFKSNGFDTIDWGFTIIPNNDELKEWIDQQNELEE